MGRHKKPESEKKVKPSWGSQHGPLLNSVQYPKELIEALKHPPENVKNLDAWKELTRLEHHPLVTSAEAHVCSNGYVVNMKMTADKLKVKLAENNVPSSEVERLLKSAKLLRSMLTHMAALRRRVWGFKNEGEKASFNSFTEFKKQEILELYGKFWTHDEVIEHIYTLYGVTLSKGSLGLWRRKYVEEIAQLQEAHKRDFSDLRLGYKRSRLEEYTELYGIQKFKWKQTESREDYKLMLATLQEIRKEVEGDKLVIDGNFHVQVEHEINLKVQREALKTLNIYDIVISRLAAKAGISPMKIISRLHSSFYAKHSGLGRTVNYEDEIIWPSQQSYDFEALGKQQAVIAEQDKQDEAELNFSIDHNRAAVVKSKREQVLEAIRRRQEEAKTSAELVQVDEGVDRRYLKNNSL